MGYEALGPGLGFTQFAFPALTKDCFKFRPEDHMSDSTCATCYGDGTTDWICLLLDGVPRNRTKQSWIFAKTFKRPPYRELHVPLFRDSDK